MIITAVPYPPISAGTPCSPPAICPKSPRCSALASGPRTSTTQTSWTTFWARRSSPAPLRKSRARRSGASIRCRWPLPRRRRPSTISWWRSFTRYSGNISPLPETPAKMPCCVTCASSALPRRSIRTSTSSTTPAVWSPICSRWWWQRKRSTCSWRARIPTSTRFMRSSASITTCWPSWCAGKWTRKESSRSAGATNRSRELGWCIKLCCAAQTHHGIDRSTLPIGSVVFAALPISFLSHERIMENDLYG